MQDGIVEFPDGSRKWEYRGKLHRTDGPAVEYADGTRMWFIHNMLHRTDGPAVEHPDGSGSWYQQDMLHRDDGPAIIYADGNYGWWLLGAEYTFDEWLKLNPALDKKKRILCALQYGEKQL